MEAGPYQFEWDEVKANTNVSRHGVTLEMASTVFHDPGLVTVPDLEHSDTEERWFSVGCASNGSALSVALAGHRPRRGEDPANPGPQSDAG